MTDSFSNLLKRSADTFQAHFPAFLLPAVALAFLVSLPMSWVNQQIDSLADLEGAVSINVPLVMIAAVVIGFVGTVYMLVIAVESKDKPGQILSRVGPLLIPLFLTYVWMFLYSFSWLGVVGLVLAALDSPLLRLVGVVVVAAGLILLVSRGPRLICAPIIVIRRKEKPRASVVASYEATKGQWWSIVGSYLLFMLCLWLISFGIGFVIGVVSSLLAPLGSIVDWVSSFVSGLVQHLFGALATCFYVHLATAALGSK